MKAYQIIFVVVLILPFLEMFLLLTVGGLIGALPTILLVVLTAACGAWLVRDQGFTTFRNLKANLEQGRVPAYEMIEGPIILVGGALLLTPGFITDALGLLCLLPYFRKRIARYVIERHLVSAGGFDGFGGGVAKRDDALEGEFNREND
jgi:UPF0716 protein FxsA